MFACVCLVSSCGVEYPVEALLQLAGDFSPRFEMVRPHVVIVEIGGLGRLLGTPREIGAAFCRVAVDRRMLVTVGIAATHTAALLLAMHPATQAPSDPVLTVVSPGREAAALASLPLSVLTAMPGDRLSADDVMYLRRHRTRGDGDAAHDAEHDAHESRSRGTPSGHGTTETAGKTRGWRGRGYSQHYRLAPAPLRPESASSTPSSAPSSLTSPSSSAGASSPTTVAWEQAVHPASAFDPSVDERRDAMLDVLRRWGLKTLGELARLPAADIFTRLGRDGLALQQIARGHDARPLVPTTADEPFEASLTLEWPIDTLEPLSFVLTRLFEPLCARLERCDRGAAVLQVTLQLVTRRMHVRRLELPAPMRDPKVLRTLVLLDLESHPPDAGIDRLTIAIDPTPGRIVQHSLLMRALPSPEQLSTLTARLTAVMGEGRVGAPQLLDTYRSEAFEMRRFEVDDTSPYRAWTRAVDGPGLSAATAVADITPVVIASIRTIAPAPSTANQPADHAWASTSGGHARFVLRRFRRAIPARVRVEDGRPVHVTPQGLRGGPVIQAAGPWRTSGEWWKSPARLQPVTSPDSSSTPPPTTMPSIATPSSASPPPAATRPRPSPLTEAWDRDEWDVALSDGTLYRIHLDHRQHRWFAEAELD